MNKKEKEKLDNLKGKSLHYQLEEVAKALNDFKKSCNLTLEGMSKRITNAFKQAKSQNQT